MIRMMRKSLIQNADIATPDCESRDACLHRSAKAVQTASAARFLGELAQLDFGKTA